MVSQSERLVSVVKERVIKNHHTDDSDEEADEEQIGDMGPDGIAEPSPAVRLEPAATEIKRDSQPMPSVEPRVEPSPVARADADERPTYTPTQLVGDEPDEEERYTEDVQEDAPMRENNADKDSDGGAELKRMGLPEPDEDGFIVIPLTEALCPTRLMLMHCWRPKSRTRVRPRRMMTDSLSYAHGSRCGGSR